MKPLTALTSVMSAAAFHAEPSGRIVESNSAFTQLMRCMPGDDWRLHVAVGDRALIDAFWASLCGKPTEIHDPISFFLDGTEDRYQLRAQAVTGDDGLATSAVGIIEVEPSTTTQRWSTDLVTGLPETEAARGRFDELLDAGRAFAAAVILLDDEHAADEIALKEASRQLLTTIRPTDLLTSSSDGRFVLCAAGIESESAATAMAQRMLDALGASSLPARVGLALPENDAGAATLMREAEAGAYASESGSFGFAPDEAD